SDFSFNCTVFGQGPCLQTLGARGLAASRKTHFLTLYRSPPKLSAMSQHVYDYAIIGSGLTGLVCATRLSQETKNVVLLDGSDQMGVINRTIAFPISTLNNGLRYLPNSAAAEQALLFLEDLMGMKLIYSVRSLTTHTFQECKLKDFLGFRGNP